MFRITSREYLEIGFICIFGLVMRLILRTEMWGYMSPDEVQYLSNAIGLFTDLPRYGAHYRPGLPFLLLPLLWILDSAYAGWLLAHAFGFVAIPISYWCGRTLKNHQVGLYMSSMVAASGAFIHYSNRILTEQPALVLGAVGLILVVICVKKQSGVAGFLAGVLLSASIFVRVSSIVIALTVLVYIVASARINKSTKELRALLWVVLGGSTPLVIGLLLFPSAIWATLTEILWSGALYEFTITQGLILQNLVSAAGAWIASVFFLNGSNTWRGLYFSFFTILATLGAAWAIKKRELSDLPILIWLVLYLGAYSIAPLRYKPDLWRYIFPAMFPASYLIGVLLSDCLPLFWKIAIDVKSWCDRNITPRMIEKATSRTSYLAAFPATLIFLAIVGAPSLLFTLTTLLWFFIVIRINGIELTSRDASILVAVLVTLASTVVPIVFYNFSIGETTIEAQELWTLSPHLEFKNSHPEADFSLWGVMYGFPSATEPTNHSLDAGGVYIWINDSYDSRRLIVVCHNDTGAVYSVKIIFRGFAVDDVASYSSHSDFNSSTTNGYFSETRLQIRSSSEGSGAILRFSPVRGSKDRRLEIDVLDKAVGGIWFGSNYVTVPHTVFATWIRFSLSPQDPEIDDAYSAVIHCRGLALDHLEFVGDGTSTANLSGNSILDFRLSVNWTGCMRMDLYFDEVSSQSPTVLLESIDMPNHGVHDLQIAVGSSLVTLPHEEKILPLDGIDSSGVHMTGLSEAGTVLVLFVTILIVLGVAYQIRPSKDIPFIIAITSVGIGLFFAALPSLFCQSPYQSLYAVGDLQPWYAFLIGSRSAYLFLLLGVTTLYIVLALRSDRIAVGQHNPAEVKMDLRVRKPICQVEKRKAPAVALMVLFILTLVTGVGFGIAETESTRDFFDCIRTSSDFLSNNYEPDLIVLTNTDGSQYLSWYTRDRFLFKEIPISQIEEADNKTQLVLDFIRSNNVSLVVIQEWLAHHLNWVYDGLAQKGILLEVRIYRDVWQRTIIYEVI